MKTNFPSVIDGWNRQIKNVSKAAAWGDKPVELRFADPQTVACVHVSLADRHNKAAFAVDAFTAGRWRELTRTPGQHKQRRYVINVDRVRTDRLRFRLIRSSAPVAIAEVRVYSQLDKPTHDGLLEPASVPAVDGLIPGKN